MIMDKIKVNLNYKLYHLLIRDMEDFLFYKENKEINKNLFYNTIVIRMYERIIKQYQQKSAQTQEILNKYHIHNLKLRDELVEVSNLLYPIQEDSNVYNESILFRPNKQFLPIFEEIEEKYLFNQSISFFYRNLFTLYANMRQDERERLVFQDSLERIEKCIRLKKGIKIKMNEKEFIFFPYKVVSTLDEQYNYVIGATKNYKFQVFSIHLYKLKDFCESKEYADFNAEEIKKLNEAIKIGPRAIAIRHYQVQVRFDKEGLRLFKKNYINRPIPLKIENDIYFFEGTYRNLFIYFAQFGCHCEVLFPYDFMMALKKWYTNAAKKYEQIAKIQKESENH